MTFRTFVSISLSLSFWLGCSTVTPASFRAKAPPLTTSWPGPTLVTAGYAEKPDSRFNANGVAFEANLDEFSKQLAGLLSDSLRNSGTKIGAGGGVIEVRVIYMDFMFQGPCLLDYSVRLSNGTVFGQQSTGKSGNFAVACTRALEGAVKKIANDVRTAKYLGGQ